MFVGFIFVFSHRNNATSVASQSAEIVKDTISRQKSVFIVVYNMYGWLSMGISNPPKLRICSYLHFHNLMSHKFEYFSAVCVFLSARLDLHLSGFTGVALLQRYLIIIFFVCLLLQPKTFENIFLSSEKTKKTKRNCVCARACILRWI